MYHSPREHAAPRELLCATAPWLLRSAVDQEGHSRTAAELERLLPSHFLRLSRHHRGRDGPRRRAPAKVDRAREAAFVAANAADAAFYELAREAFMGRRLACHGNSS